MSKPDIIFIITDHHAWYGHFINPDGTSGGIAPQALPVWEQFCTDGARFNNAYSICPLCTPARSSMMSGLKPHKHGLCLNTDAGGEFQPGTRLLNHELADAGYQTHYVGKWHCGHDLLPTDYDMPGWSLTKYGNLYTSDAYKTYCKDRGLDDARALIEQNIDHPEWIGETLTLHHDCPWHFMNGSGVMQGPRAGHESDFIAHLAKEKLNELTDHEKPFAMVASWWAPHQPYYPTEPFANTINPADIAEHPSYQDDLSDKPERYLVHRHIHHPGVNDIKDWKTWQPVVARCYEQCLQTDAAVGQFLDELEKSGRADNTIVVWCADHGDALGGHGGLWDKATTMTEEVMRIPLAVRWPKQIPAGTVINDFVSNLDCPATILEAAGCPIPNNWDSRSLLPLIRQEEQREEIICEHHGHGATIIPQRMLRHGKWKYVAALYDGDELYDLETDPWELHNVINDPAYTDIIRSCRSKITDHLGKEAWTDHGRRIRILLEQRQLPQTNTVPALR